MDELKEILQRTLLRKKEFKEVLSNQTEFNALVVVVNREFQKAVEWARLSNDLAYVNNYMDILCHKFPEASPILISRIVRFLPLVWRSSDGTFLKNRKIKAKFTRELTLKFDLIVCDANELVMGAPEKEKKWKLYLEKANEATFVEVLRQLLKDKLYKGFKADGIYRILKGIQNQRNRKIGRET